TRPRLEEERAIRVAAGARPPNGVSLVVQHRRRIVGVAAVAPVVDEVALAAITRLFEEDARRRPGAEDARRHVVLDRRRAVAVVQVDPTIETGEPVHGVIAVASL